MVLDTRSSELFPSHAVLASCAARVIMEVGSCRYYSGSSNEGISDFLISMLKGELEITYRSDSRSIMVRALLDVDLRMLTFFEHHECTMKKSIGRQPSTSSCTPLTCSRKLEKLTSFSISQAHARFPLSSQ